MQSWILALLLVANTAIAAPQSLRVETLNRSFTITLDDKRVFLRSSAGSGVIQRTTCNESLVHAFWSDGIAEVKRFPKIKGGTLQPAVILNGQRYLMRSLRSPAAVKNLERKFYALQIQERLKCKRK